VRWVRTKGAGLLEAVALWLHLKSRSMAAVTLSGGARPGWGRGSRPRIVLRFRFRFRMESGETNIEWARRGTCRWSAVVCAFERVDRNGLAHETGRRSVDPGGPR